MRRYAAPPPAIHGDRFDAVVRHARRMALPGHRAYVVALHLNQGFNWLRRRCTLRFRSLSAYLKHKVRNAVSFIVSFETALADAARHCGIDGIVCGRVHFAQVWEIDGVLYCNDGNRVASCIALVERHGGRLEIVHGTEDVGNAAELEPATAG